MGGRFSLESKKTRKQIVYVSHFIYANKKKKHQKHNQFTSFAKKIQTSSCG